MKKRSLAIKLSLSLAFLGVLILATTLVAAYLRLRTLVAHEVEKHLTSSNRFVESVFKNYIKGKFEFLESVAQVLAETDDFSLVDKQARAVRFDSDSVFLRIQDPSSRVVYSSLPDDPWLEKVINVHAAGTHGFHMGIVKEGQTPKLRMYVFSYREKELAYVVSLYIDLAYLQETLFSAGWIGETGETYLVSKDGFMLTHSRFFADLKRRGLIPPEATTTSMVLKVVEPGTGKLVYSVRKAFETRGKGCSVKPYLDYRGVSVVGAWSYLPELDAALITEEDVSEAFLPLYSTMRVLFLSFTAILIVIFLGSLLWIKSFVKKVDTIRTGIDRVASGDLTFELSGELSGQDEIASICFSLKKMLEFLRSAVSRIKTVSESLTGASSEVSESVEIVSRSVQDQVASMEEISSSIEEILNSLKLLNERARDVESLTEKARNEAQEGRNLMDQLMESVKKAQEASSRINQIIMIIKDIAEQTNLLALNASIEAARAGEAGKGFAVVAEEISKLASNSSQATKEIENLLKQTQTSTGDAFDKTQKASASFNDIVEDVDKVNSSIREFVVAFDEQTGAMEEVGKSVESVTRASQEINQQVEELSAVAENLDSLAGALNELVASFKLSEKKESQGTSSIENTVKDITPL